MKRLQQISTEKTLSVEVKCVLNEHVIDKNFEAIIDCLKELHETNSRLEKDIKQANDRSSQCEKDLQRLKEAGGELISASEATDTKATSRTNQQNAVVQLSDASALQQLQERLAHTEEHFKKSNIENLKDINLLLSEMKDVKKKLDDLETKSQGSGNSGALEQLSHLQGGSLDIDTTRILQNELQRHLEMINKLTADLDKLRDQNSQFAGKLGPLEGLDKKLADLQNSFDQSVANSSKSSDSNSLRDQLAKIESDLKRLDMLEQRFRLAPTSQDLDDRFAELRNITDEHEQTLHILQEELADLKNKKTVETKPESKTETAPAKVVEPKTESVGRRDKQMDGLHESEHRQLKDMLKELTLRVDDLEASLRESKEKIATSVKDVIEERQAMNTTTYNEKEKMLPNINKRSIRLKQPRESVHNQSRDHSTKDVDRRLFDLKGELQQWLRQLLESRNEGNKNEEHLNDIELKLQELKIAVERKADQEGVRKYLTFLENKINQLFMVLAQPESEDALIARKGWGCLSCAKKLEKYKGRIGDHLNWNNMTTTNYSPPRIGFTQTQTNHKSGEPRNRFASLADKNTSFHYEEHHSQEK